MICAKCGEPIDTENDRFVARGALFDAASETYHAYCWEKRAHHGRRERPPGAQHERTTQLPPLTPLAPMPKRKPV